MSDEKRGTIEGDNAQLKAFAEQIALSEHLPPGSEPHRLAQTLGDLPSLPDRFNAAFLKHGWIFVEFACGHEPALRGKASAMDQRTPSKQISTGFAARVNCSHHSC